MEPKIESDTLVLKYTHTHTQIDGFIGQPGDCGFLAICGARAALLVCHTPSDMMLRVPRVPATLYLASLHNCSPQLQLLD